MRRMEKQHKLKVILHFRKLYKLNPIFLHLSRIMEGCGQKRRTRHEEGRKGQRCHHQRVFLENNHLAITIFKDHANFHFSFQSDWLLKEYLDAMMRLGAVGVGRECGFQLSQGTGYILDFFTHWA